MSVTSTDNGDHWVCVSLDSAEFALPDGAKMVRCVVISSATEAGIIGLMVN